MANAIREAGARCGLPSKLPDGRSSLTGHAWKVTGARVLGAMGVDKKGGYRCLCEVGQRHHLPIPGRITLGLVVAARTACLAKALCPSVIPMCGMRHRRARTQERDGEAEAHGACSGGAAAGPGPVGGVARTTCRNLPASRRSRGARECSRSCCCCFIGKGSRE